MRQFYLAILTMFCFTTSFASTNVEKMDIEYLKNVYKATFDCIVYFVEPETGLPYDVSDYREATSISNIGLYLAVVSIGYKTGLISKEEAVKKIDKTLTSLEKIERWNGFPITWINVKTLEQEYGESFSYADHIGNLVCGLLVVDGIFHKEFGERIYDIINNMDFSSTYDENTGWLKGGYNTKKKDFEIEQPWGKWYYNLYASDTRHFSLIGITLGKIPTKHWKKLIREYRPWGKLDKEMLKFEKYYSPGMEGGGLFMQFLPMIFLPEKDLLIGKSARNFAYAQIQLSKVRGYYPYWGISASESPDGNSYLGWGTLKEEIVTPHTSVLAIEFFPQEVVENLKSLEKVGIRPLYDEKYDFGFTDAYDIKNNVCSKHYLCLDQSMLFLSLANFLHNEVVRKTFAKSVLGKKVVEQLRMLEKVK